MIGMDRRTGLPLSGVAHLRQSIEDILTTPLGRSQLMKAELIDEDWLRRNLPDEVLTIGYQGTDGSNAG